MASDCIKTKTGCIACAYARARARARVTYPPRGSSARAPRTMHFVCVFIHVDMMASWGQIALKNKLWCVPFVFQFAIVDMCLSAPCDMVLYGVIWYSSVLPAVLWCINTYMYRRAF